MSEVLVATLSKRCQHIVTVNGRETLWPSLRTERQRRERRDMFQHTITEQSSGSFHFRPLLSDASKCDFCGKLAEKHYGPLSFCYLSVFTEPEEGAAGGGTEKGTDKSCMHCGQERGAHFTEFLFCHDSGRRQALEEARRKNLFKTDLEEDVGGARTPLLVAVQKSDFSSVRQLLMAGANVGATDKFGRLVRPHTPRVHASILVRPIYVLLLPLESLLASLHVRLE